MQRRFGVEIELVGLTTSQAQRVLSAAGLNAQNEFYNHNVRDYWKATTDGSVQGTGCEVVSPILQGEAGLDEMARAMQALEAAGADINKSCGFHVHIEARGLNAASIANVIHRYARYEEQIDAFMPPSRRGNINTYCKTLRRLQITGDTPEAIARCYPIESTVRGHSTHSRYYKINMQSYIKYGTMEFRQHSGTINAVKAKNWVRFLQAFVEASVVSSVPMVAPTASVVTQVETLDRNLRGSERKIIAMLRVSNRSLEEMASECGITVDSASCVLSRLRAKGYRIRRTSMGRYNLQVDPTGTVTRTVTTPAAQVANAIRELWDGVPHAVREFYRVRVVALA